MPRADAAHQAGAQRADGARRADATPRADAGHQVGAQRADAVPPADAAHQAGAQRANGVQRAGVMHHSAEHVRDLAGPAGATRARAQGFRQGAIENKAVVTARGSRKGGQDHLLEQGSAAGGAGAARAVRVPQGGLEPVGVERDGVGGCAARPRVAAREHVPVEGPLDVEASRLLVLNLTTDASDLLWVGEMRLKERTLALRSQLLEELRDGTPSIRQRQHAGSERGGAVHGAAVPQRPGRPTNDKCLQASARALRLMAPQWRWSHTAGCIAH